MKLQKKFNVFLAIFGIIVGIYSLFMAPFIMPFVLGGVILQGILGGFSGKVGPVVGGKWKDINYMRGYVVPANPNTVPQQTVRAKFAQLVSNAREILPTILQPFWDPFQTSMSGFNAFISQNYANSDVNGVMDATAIMSRGTLEPLLSFVATYNTATGEVIPTWSEVVTGNGLSTDEVSFLIYDEANKMLYPFADQNSRQEEAGSVTIRSGLSAAAVFVFGFANQGTGSALIVSDSVGVVASAP